MRVHNAESEALLGASRVFIGAREYPVRSARKAPGAFLIEVRGVGDRDAAEELRDAPVAVTRDDIPTEESEILLADLVGCEVVLKDGSPYGEIDDVEPGPQDRLVIAQGEVERMLPLVSAFVVDIDLASRKVVVDPPEGLPESRRG